MTNLDNLITVSKPNSFITERYKMLRTNINYLNVDRNTKVVMITSSVSEEGKSTTVSNLAVTMAQDGKRVLVIDADLRRPKIHEIFQLSQMPGVTDVVYDSLFISEAIKSYKKVNKLDILTAGKLPISASEFIGSEAFKNLIFEMKELYDIVLIDVPPVLSVSDAVIISQFVDGVILTVAANQTKKKLIVRSIKALNAVNANIIGTILTKVDKKIQKDYYKDNYYYKK